MKGGSASIHQRGEHQSGSTFLFAQKGHGLLVPVLPIRLWACTGPENIPRAAEPPKNYFEDLASVTSGNHFFYLLYHRRIRRENGIKFYIYYKEFTKKCTTEEDYLYILKNTDTWHAEYARWYTRGEYHRSREGNETILSWRWKILSRDSIAV